MTTISTTSHKGKENAKRVAKNTGFLYIRMAITVFISLYVTRLLLASLGTEDFGIYNLVAGIVAMLVFLNAAMAAASQRFMSYAHGQGGGKLKSIFNVSLLLHFIIGIVVCLLLEFVGYFLFESVLNIPEERLQAAKYVFQFMVTSTFFTIICVPYDALINARENMLFVAISGVLESFFKLGVAIYITYTDFDKLITFGLLMALLAILMLCIKWVYCHKNYIEAEVNFKKYLDRKLFYEMGGFASWSFLGASSSMLTMYGQGILLNVFFGSIVNAAQGVANQVSGQLGALSTTMLKALTPMIVRSEGEGDRRVMLEATMMGSKLSFFLIALLYIPIMLEMSYLFSIWLVEVPKFLITFCYLLLLQNLVRQFFIPLEVGISAVGHIKSFQLVFSFINIFPLFIAWGLFALGYPPHFIYITMIGRAIVLGVNALYFSKNKFGLNIVFFIKNNIIRGGGAFALIYLLLYFMTSNIVDEQIKLLVLALAYIPVFTLVLVFIGFNTYERNTLKGFIIKYYHSKFNNKVKFS
ncbi:hypothetical protein FE810_09015 [Thalassotalea litorea]|uniref:Polysaccharide biosynthesis protein n=1 Tax=Thalassotalea litorea TaxID=2020715 RepID=A0A5R9IT07_9GAMM|nr:MATE family efflux transporter [Thalassotalea litorea]TLU65058.1 hypothetical protein FE810_09015 [Thalassotalea litorea]